MPICEMFADESRNQRKSVLPYLGQQSVCKTIAGLTQLPRWRGLKPRQRHIVVAVSKKIA